MMLIIEWVTFNMKFMIINSGWSPRQDFNLCCMLPESVIEVGYSTFELQKLLGSMSLIYSAVHCQIWNAMNDGYVVVPFFPWFKIFKPVEF